MYDTILSFLQIYFLIIITFNGSILLSLFIVMLVAKIREQRMLIAAQSTSNIVIYCPIPKVIVNHMASLAEAPIRKMDSCSDWIVELIYGEASLMDRFGEWLVEAMFGEVDEPAEAAPSEMVEVEQGNDVPGLVIQLSLKWPQHAADETEATSEYVDPSSLPMVNLSTDVSCSVCHDVLGSKVSALPCGHTFHLHCITGCLTTNCICPTCRAPAPQGSLIRELYFNK